MPDYNFWSDLLDTYQSLSDWVKTLWLIVPPAFIIALAIIVSRHKIAYRRAETPISGDLVYTICRNDYDQLHVYRHGEEVEDLPALVLVDKKVGDSRGRVAEIYQQ